MPQGVHSQSQMSCPAVSPLQIKLKKWPAGILTSWDFDQLAGRSYKVPIAQFRFSYEKATTSCFSSFEDTTKCL